MDYKGLSGDSKKPLLDQAKDIKNKVLENENVKNKISEGLDKVEKKVEELGSGVKHVVDHVVDKDKLTIDSLALVYLSFELVPPLITMILASIFLISFIISWLLLVAVVIDVILYVILLKFKDKIKNSSSSVAFAIMLSVCEGIILSSLGSAIDTTLFSAQLAILIVGLAVAAVFAGTLKDKYVANSGRRIGIVVSFNISILLILFLPKDVITLVIPI